jgi:hypothetical protein
VHEQQLLRQPPALDDARQLARDVVDDAGVDRADDLTGNQTLGDVPLRVQRQR